MIKRTRAREQALQVLYFMDLLQSSSQEAMGVFANHFENKECDQVFSESLIEGVEDQEESLNKTIQEKLTNWKLSRLARVDRCVLRLATYELLYFDDIPHSVTIDEAIELGKKYGDHKTASFLNGVLDKIAKECKA